MKTISYYKVFYWQIDSYKSLHKYHKHNVLQMVLMNFIGELILYFLIGFIGYAWGWTDGVNSENKKYKGKKVDGQKS